MCHTYGITTETEANLKLKSTNPFAPIEHAVAEVDDRSLEEALIWLTAEGEKLDKQADKR